MNTMSTYSPSSALSIGAWQAHTTWVWVAFAVVGIVLMVLLALIVRSVVRATIHHMQSLQTSQMLFQSAQSYHRHTAGFPRRDYARADRMWNNNATVDEGLVDDGVPTFDVSPFMAARDNAPADGHADKAHRMPPTGNTHHDTQLAVLVHDMAMDRLATRMPELLENEERHVLHEMGYDVH